MPLYEPFASVASPLPLWCDFVVSHSFLPFLCQQHTQQPSSMMSFEGQQFQGPENIINKLKGTGQVQHTVKSTDVQPSSNPNAILIFVTGSIKIGGDNPLHFCEMFQLVSTAPGA
jgi:hypothetical protein